MNGEEYSVCTLVEMARIPEEAFGRFMAEFPMMVHTMRGHIAMMEGLHRAGVVEAADNAAIFAATKGLRWIDDDKGNVTVRVSAEDPDGTVTDLMRMDANYKTGALSVDFASVDTHPKGGDSEADPFMGSAGPKDDAQGIPANPLISGVSNNG